jgi:hypothetical protein
MVLKSTEIFVTISDGTHEYYLLKVIKHDEDIYCIPPHLGIHYSLHKSGKSHFRHEGQQASPEKQPPVALIMGEAGKPINGGIICGRTTNAGRASCICTAIFPINSLSHDFQKFNRRPIEKYVINSRFFPQQTMAVEIGIWEVPTRNTASFELNKPNISITMLYKTSCCEPQIWIYTSPI